MKAIFAAYNQAYNEEIIELLDSFDQRGFSRWSEVSGRGMSTGEPHYGNHAWPIMNHAVITFTDDVTASKIMKALHEKDLCFEDLGLRAFCWQVDDFV